MEKPNILIFLIDQVPFDFVEPGHPCQMPHARKLASEGLLFTRAFTPSPHCCPARATFMTGLYPSRHGVWNNVNTDTAFQGGLNRGVRTFSEYLKRAGYHLGYAGKYHISNEETPADRGWEEFSPYVKHYVQPTLEEWAERARQPGEPNTPRRANEILRPGWGAFQTVGKRVESWDELAKHCGYHVRVEEGLQAIQTLSKRGGPWTVCISTDMGHGSAVLREIAEQYDPEAIQLPASFHDDLADKPRVYQRMRYQLWGQQSEREVRAAIAHYYALASQQDRYLGMILDELDKTGQRDNTLVVFLADHGDYNYAHGLQEMGIPAFREAYHIPVVMRWPGGIARPGRHIGEFVTLADFAPTFLELAGQVSAERLTGRSLAPFLRGEAAPAGWPDAWCSQTKGNECYYTQRIVATKRWKYVCNWFDFDELYDLQADPHEIKNLAFPQRLPEACPPPGGCTAAGARDADQPWPPLPTELDAARRDLLGRMWRFAFQEKDSIFNYYYPVALPSYGPLLGLRSKS